MNRELLKVLYNKATDACIAKAETNPNLAWTFEEEYARVIIEECVNVVTSKLRTTPARDALIDHFGIVE